MELYDEYVPPNALPSQQDFFPVPDNDPVLFFFDFESLFAHYLPSCLTSNTVCIQILQ